MRFDVITLFPELFEPFQRSGVNRRAFESGAIDLRLWQLRDFSDDNYRRVDDRPYGGGPGMVMLVEPMVKALRAIRQDYGGHGCHGDHDSAGYSPPPQLPVIMFSPAGPPLTQARVQALAQGPGAVLVCGRYEGIDQRFIDAHVDEEISLGDYVLSGGELPALTLIDAVARLQPGVLHDAQSHQQDSFSDGLLDCSHYSRPPVLDAEWQAGEVMASRVDPAVPPVLMSGHHGDIAKWRRQRQLALTLSRRPELIEAARACGRLTKEDERFLNGLL